MCIYTTLFPISFFLFHLLLAFACGVFFSSGHGEGHTVKNTYHFSTGHLLSAAYHTLLIYVCMLVYIYKWNINMLLEFAVITQNMCILYINNIIIIIMIKIFIYKSCLSVYMRKRVGRQCRKRFHFCIFSVCVCDVDLIRYIFNNFSHNTKTDLSTGDIELKARGKKKM